MVDSTYFHELFAGGGEMGALMRSKDWGRTRVGAPSEWPQSLKTAVRIILHSRFPMFIWWGRELINLYNDSYASILGKKHPSALGESAREAWAEIWDQIGPRADAVLLRGEATLDERLLLVMDRHGYEEETYFTFSYSPLPADDGTVGGLFCAVTEVTSQVIGERRLALLRRLAAQTASARTAESVCQRAGECLQDANRDLPFSIIYLRDAQTGQMRPVSSTGFSSVMSPLSDADAENCWDAQSVMASGQSSIVRDLGSRLAEVPRGAWPRKPDAALVVPLAQQGQETPVGVLIVGVNPYRELDEEFSGYVTLIAGQIAAGIANAKAYEAERKRAEALAELDRAKTAFFNNVSHELRTPLTLILGPVEDALAERASDRALRGDQLELLHRNGLRLLKLVNTLLDFSRIEAGRIHACYQRTDIRRLTEELASTFRAAIERAGLVFNVTLDEIEGDVYLDREMWEKIVLNLLSNAFKYTISGAIALRLRDVRGNVELSVADTGCGIPETELKRVFERFHRVEGATGRTNEGTGIGLSLVQELVRLHGGTVEVRSVAGEGTEFTITLPTGFAHLPEEKVRQDDSRARPNEVNVAFVQEALRWIPMDGANESEAESIANPATSAIPVTEAIGAKVLLVDDNADLRDYLKRLLSPVYRVTDVADGEAALEMIHKDRPDLVLSDIMMPKLDGYGLLKALRSDQETRTLPIILLSARAGEESRIEGLEAGADDYLVKPFTARELLARIGAHITMSRFRREAMLREQQLRDEAQLERNRWWEAFMQAPAAIAMLSGPEHRWTFVNPAYMKIVGRADPATFMGKPIRETLPELEGQGYFELLDQVYRTGVPFVGNEMEVDVNRGVGHTPEHAYFDFIYHAAKDVSGKVQGIFVQAIDVTEQVLARKELEANQEVLKKSAALLSAALAASQTGTYRWVPSTGKYLDFDENLKQLFGLPLDSPVERTEQVLARIHPDDRLHVEEALENCRRGSDVSLEYRVVMPDGSIRWLYSRGKMERKHDGSPDCLVGASTDITSRKTTQERLEIAQRAAQLATWDWELATGDVRWTPASAQVYGRPFEQLSRIELCTSFVHEEDRESTMKALQRAIEDRTEYDQEFRVIWPDGSIHHLAGRGRVVYGLDGRPISVVGMNWDVTEKKKAEDALRRSEKLAAAGRLAATVAHEINNPLEAVTNLLFLAQTTNDALRVREYLALADQELRRVAYITRQTLGFYRESAGPVHFNLAQALDDVLELHSRKIKEKQITVERNYSGAGQIYGMQGEIRQVLANLISNALDASFVGGYLGLRLHSVGLSKSQARGWRVTIADNGCGIAPQHVSKIFEPFFTTKKDVGTGLGLWVSRGIIDKHGGKIQLKSHALPPSQGTVFSVILPEAMEEAPREVEFVERGAA